jgi:hypothetical protein
MATACRYQAGPRLARAPRDQGSDRPTTKDCGLYLQCTKSYYFSTIHARCSCGASDRLAALPTRGLHSSFRDGREHLQSQLHHDRAAAPGQPASTWSSHGYTLRMRQKGSDGVGGYHRDECPSLSAAFMAAAGSALIGWNCCDRNCISFSSGGEGLGDIIRTDGATEWKYVFQRPISRTRHLRELQCN